MCSPVAVALNQRQDAPQIICPAIAFPKVVQPRAVPRDLRLFVYLGNVREPTD